MALPNTRDFPNADSDWHRKAVCKKCHVPMSDFEPMSPHGEYYHPKEDKNGKPHTCPNAGMTFTDRDKAIEPFLRKSVRRAHKRMGIRP
jgi:hypothetical protein